MGKYIKGVNRNQVLLLPDSVEDYVEGENEVRVIEEFVNVLDVEKAGFKRTKPNYEGAPCYDPRDMLKLYMYGYLNKIRSSRKLEKETRRNLEVIWLMSNIKPDFRTISDFRKDNIKALKETFKAFNKMCLKLNLFGKELESQDGTKIQAVNSKDNNFTKSKLDERLERLNNKISEYLEDLEKNDEVEVREKIMVKIEEAKNRIKQYTSYLNELEETGEKQKSITDKDSRLMQTNGKFIVGYNVQTVTESKNHLVTNYKVTNSATDHGTLEELSNGSKEVLEVEEIEHLADGGYTSKEDIVKCLENKVVPILPKNKKGYYELEEEYEESMIDEETRKGSTKEEVKKCLKNGVIPECYKHLDLYLEVKEKIYYEEISKEEELKSEEEMIRKAKEGYFVRDIKKDKVYCPMGKILRKKSSNEKRDRYYNDLECKRCKNKCTKAKRKEIDFSKQKTEIKSGYLIKEVSGKKEMTNEVHMKRTQKKRKIVIIKYKPDKEKYKRRMGISEHPFGTIKRDHDAGYFLLKGMEKVDGEMSLTFLTYNIRRIINILGVKKCIESIKEYEKDKEKGKNDQKVCYT